MTLLAKLYLDGDIFFLILRSKIRKKMSPSKESFAAAGGERLFTQPHDCVRRMGLKPVIYRISIYQRNSFWAKQDKAAWLAWISI